ncbi:hypothetical protein AAZX31_08G238600 [Glycine max]
MSYPHFLVVPYPILGHMNPLLQFSQVLANHGCKITFFLSLNHLGAQIKLVTLPHGLDPEDDRSDQPKVILSLKSTMPTKLHELILDINNNNALDADNNNKITCLVVSKNIGWALEVAHKLGIKGALLWPASATSLASFESIRLIDEGIIDSQTGFFRGPNPLKNQLTKSPLGICQGIPHSISSILIYYGPQTNISFKSYNDLKYISSINFSYCENISPFVMAKYTEGLPRVPVSPTTMAKCPACCHVSLFRQHLVNLSIDLLKKPFLWVVRPSNDNNKVNNPYPNEFHGSKACFNTYCGWNSIIEGVCGGIPFLCWPFFSDQFINKSYVCDVWKVGLGLNKDENGLILKGEIKARSLKKKDLTMNNSAEGGQSSKNLKKFIIWAKG